MKIDKSLPNSLPGAVVAQYRTANGKTHGPYWFRFWREGGRLRKAYVRPSDLEEARAAFARGRDARRKVATMRVRVTETRAYFALLMRLLRRMDGDGRIEMSEDELRRAERFTGTAWTS